VGYVCICYDESTTDGRRLLSALINRFPRIASDARSQPRTPRRLSRPLLPHPPHPRWFLWDTGIDDAVARLPNHERVFHEWGQGTGPIWRKPITLAAQLEEIHVKPSDIELMAVSHSHPDHAGNIEMFPNPLMLVQRVEYEWAGSRQDTVAFNKKHPLLSG